jgi:hypothetical protein
LGNRHAAYCVCRVTYCVTKHRCQSLTAARQGEAFDVETGRPVAWQRQEDTITWYDLSLSYAAMKWPYAAPTQRRSIAEALTDATETMLSEPGGPWPSEQIRQALRSWAFSDRMRGANKPPDDITPIVRWLENATIPNWQRYLADLQPALAGMYDQLHRRFPEERSA